MFLVQVGSASVPLPSPEEENEESLALSTRVRRSIGGGFYTTNKTDSAETLLSYSFQSVPLSTMKLLHSTILANPAATYTITDHCNVQWSVRLLNDPFPSTTDDPFGCTEEGSFELQFRGVRLIPLGGLVGSAVQSSSASAELSLTGMAFSINTNNTSAGSSAADEFQLPLIASGTYNFTVNWGDGNQDTITTWNQAETLHTYTVAGNYDVTITGVITGWQFSNSGDRLKILTLTNWGDLDINNIEAFYGCSNMTITALDTPTFSATDVRSTFQECSLVTTIPSINSWDMSGVQIFRNFFADSDFQGDLNNWNVSSGTEFVNMFLNCSNFNGNIDNWNMSSATTLAFMFSGCSSFNRDISSWNVASVTVYSSMFRDCIVFNQNISTWSVSTAAGLAINEMFRGCTVFNQPVGVWGIRPSANCANVFRSCEAFNQDLSAWNMTDVTTVSAMFLGCIAFNSPLNWTFTVLANMANTFNGCTVFNQSINSWNVATVTSLNGTFRSTGAYNQPINLWNTGNVSTMGAMFFDATAFDQDISALDYSSVTNMVNMFNAASPFSTANYDLLLVALDGQTLQSSVQFDVGNTQYSAGAPATARSNIITGDSWTINDGGQV